MKNSKPNKSNNTMGPLLKSMRKNQGMSIKKLSTKLKVNYTYISKLENNKSQPSEDILSKFSDIFGYDKEELLIRAGKIPDDLLEIFRDNPKEAANFLREKFYKSDLS